MGLFFCYTRCLGGRSQYFEFGWDNSVFLSGGDVRWCHGVSSRLRAPHAMCVCDPSASEESHLFSSECVMRCVRSNHPSFLIAIWLTARRKMAIECRSGTIQNLSEDGRRLRVNTSREVNRSVDVRRNQESEFHLAPLQRRGFWILFSSTFSPSRVVFGQVDLMMF